LSVCPHAVLLLCLLLLLPQARAPNQQEDLIIISWGNKLVSYKHTEGKGREGKGRERGTGIHSSH